METVGRLWVPLGLRAVRRCGGSRSQPPALGKYTTYGAVLEVSTRGPLSFGWGGWAALLKPSTVSSSLGVQPRARTLSAHLGAGGEGALEGRLGPGCLLPRGESWAPLLPRTHLQTQG